MGATWFRARQLIFVECIFSRKYDSQECIIYVYGIFRRPCKQMAPHHGQPSLWMASAKLSLRNCFEGTILSGNCASCYVTRPNIHRSCPNCNSTQSSFECTCRGLSTRALKCKFCEEPGSTAWSVSIAYQRGGNTRVFPPALM